jgi:hypothetical protein
VNVRVVSHMERYARMPYLGSPNNRMQREGHDKVHAKASSCALQAQRTVADAGR